MEGTGFISSLIMLVTAMVTYRGFKDLKLFRDGIFRVDPILKKAEYWRMLTSGLFHASWLHFGLNLAALLVFSDELEQLFGDGRFLMIFALSLIGGNLFSLYRYRNQGDYQAVGASGAISGLIFASIVLYPESNITFFMLPYEVKAWTVGVFFVLVSTLLIKRQVGMIGHEAHIGGLITGVILTAAIYPEVLIYNAWVVVTILIPTMAFLIFIVKDPITWVRKKFAGKSVAGPMRDSSRRPRPSTAVSVALDPETELNKLLDKIRAQGYQSLTYAEMARLQSLREQL